MYFGGRYREQKRNPQTEKQTERPPAMRKINFLYVLSIGKLEFDLNSDTIFRPYVLPNF
jgi:hypothetical protein